MSTGKSFIPLLAVIVLSAVVDGLDGTIVTVALPGIAEALGISAADSSWIITVYFLMMASLILIIGKVCDRGALKKVLAAGFIIFTAGSLFCGLAQDFGTMLVFRGVQGIGGGMLTSSGVLIAVKYLPRSLTPVGLAAGVLGYSAGGACGPVVGGVLMENFNWEWIFFINIPIGIFGTLLTMRYVPADHPSGKSRFDIAGAVLLFISMFSGLYAIESVPSHGLNWISAAALIVFVSGITVFVIIEKRAADPVLFLSVFRRPATVISITIFLLVNACCMGIIYLLPFYMVAVSGYGAVTCGLFMCIQAVITLVVCIPVSRRVAADGNRRYIILALISMLAASAVLITSPEPGAAALIISLAGVGLTWGFGGGSFGNAVVDSVDEDKRSAVSPMVSFIIYFGSALGSALYSGLFAIGSGVPGTMTDAIPPEVFADGFWFAMCIGTVLSVIALVLGLCLKKDRA